jgi:hypothetical protein
MAAIILWGFNQMKPKIPSKDYLAILDSSKKKVKIVTNKESITYISDVIGNVASKENGVHKRPDKIAKLKACYELHQVKPKFKTKIYVYSNKTLTLKEIPIISYGTWNLTDRQYKKLLDMKE